LESRLSTGKLPPELLRGLVLGRLGARRPETLVPAAVGIDAAVIGLDPEWACVLTCDPITTASSGAGRLAVHVVCNDLASMGAEPIGILTTLLFPAGVAAADIGALMTDIDATALSMNIEVLGGHTEVAPGLSSPLVVMTGVGKVRRDRVLTAGGGRPGAALVLSKAAALEGSHVLAGDLFSRLLQSGVSEAFLQEARGYGEELSVVAEARLAVELGALAMHDPTEGGVIGAVWEMAEASGCGFRMRVSAIPVRGATRSICEALGVDPLRLIASGALLIACPDGAAMVTGLGSQGIEAAEIGELTPLETGRLLVHPDDHEETVESVGRDELYRVLEENPP
jgi:hydrogenase maturation factor